MLPDRAVKLLLGRRRRPLPQDLRFSNYREQLELR